jgi:putative oxidoreductase
MNLIERFSRVRERVVSTTEKMRWLAPLLLRITVGITFVLTGWGKVQNIGKVIAFFQELGIPAAEIQAPFVAYTELVCGVLILVGLATRLAAVPLAGTMIVALITAKRADIHGIGDLVGQTEFVYLVVFVVIAVLGPGAVSIDKLLSGKLERAPRLAPAATQ